MSAIPTAQDIIKEMDAPTPTDKALVEKAYVFAAEAHKDHKRFNGDPYLCHPAETAKEIAKLGLGAETIAAGLLHDSIEDVGVSPKKIEAEFGKEIRFLVEGVSKLGAFKYHGTERHRESLRKLLVATGKDTRVLIIKLMDRLHNMRTLQFVPREKQKRIALETLEIYAAIAHRLGMGMVRRELEDLSFEYAYPEEFAATKKLLTERAKETFVRLEKMTRTLKKEFAENSITDFRSDFRVKGLYSLWQKLKRKEGDITKIYDVAALRIVVPTIPDCYRVLGIVNNLWQPLPNKIKDYIAFPKPNGYQSIHTTVFTGDGGIVEVQVRTPEMHQESQYGIAAHVIFKEKDAKTDLPAQAGGLSGQGEHRQTSFDWIKSLIPGLGRRLPAQAGAGKTESAPKPERNRRYGAAGGPEWLADLQEETNDPDFETTLKTDLFSRRVFVFTPKGDVVDLPVDATSIDFAYAIHSDIGDRVFGAKVNGKLVPLDTVLHNADIVEIQTKKNARPSRKWLDFARTTLARRHIRTALEKERAK